MKSFLHLMFPCLLASLAAAPVTQDTLAIGDPAPQLAAMAWPRGRTVNAFERGHVYLVDFWATWCVPCRMAMPHLTAWQKKYAGRLTVIGVSVRERVKPDQVVGHVTKFLNSPDCPIDYTVAVDDPAAAPIFQSWMGAAGREGIPTAFVIAQDGRIAWIATGAGTEQIAGLEAALERALAGPLDYSAERRRMESTAEDKRAAEERSRQVIAGLVELAKTGDSAAVVAAADRILAGRAGAPITHLSVVRWLRLVALLHVDAVAGMSYGRALVDGTEPLGVEMSRSAREISFAHYISGEAGLAPEAYALARSFMESHLASTEGAFQTWELLSRVRLRTGDRAGAIAAQERAVQCIRAFSDDPKYRNAIATAEGTLKSLREAGP